MCVQNRPERRVGYEKKYNDPLIVLTSNSPFCGSGGRMSTSSTNLFGAEPSLSCVSPSTQSAAFAAAERRRRLGADCPLDKASVCAAALSDGELPSVSNEPSPAKSINEAGLVLRPSASRPNLACSLPARRLATGILYPLYRSRNYK